MHSFKNEAKLKTELYDVIADAYADFDNIGRKYFPQKEG
jgi:hypothetical protein